MIIILAVATFFFNIAYLVILFNEAKKVELLKEKNFQQLIINGAMETMLVMVKFSITGLLFFVSGEVFRKNLYAIFETCFRCCQK